MTKPVYVLQTTLSVVITTKTKRQLMKRMMIRETTSLDEYSDESDSEY